MKFYYWFLIHDFYNNRYLKIFQPQEQKTTETQPEILVMLSPSTSPDGDSDIPTQEKPESGAYHENPTEHIKTPSEQQTAPQPEESPTTPVKELADQLTLFAHEEEKALPPREDLTLTKSPQQRDVVEKQQPPSPSAQHNLGNVEAKEEARPRTSILSMTSQLLKASHARQGNSLAQRDGEDRMPSLQELKYLSYQQRIDEMIMNSWRIVSRSFRPSHENLSLESKASISFEIKKDGTLAFVTLTSSSGNQRFDKAVIEAVKQAAPFPPIPAHLGLERFRPVGGYYHVRW